MGQEQSPQANVVKSAATITVEPPLFVVKSTGVLALTIETVMAKAKSLKNEKGNYTVEYFCEEMLADKLKSFNDYLDANEERKNRELFVKATNALTVPDMAKPDELKAYVSKIEALQRKYRQGSYKAEV